MGAHCLLPAVPFLLAAPAVRFHGSTFECVAEGYAISVHVGSMAGALPEMSRRMGYGAPAT